MNSKKLISIILAVSFMLPVVSCAGKAKDTEESVSSSQNTTAEVTTAGSSSEETVVEEESDEESNFVTLPDDFSQTAVMVPVGDNGFMAPENGFEITRPDWELYHYDMDITFNPDNNTVGGHVVFTFYNDSDEEWDKLCFRDHSAIYMEPDALHWVEEDAVTDTNADMTVIENITDKRDDSVLEYTRDEDITVIWIDLDEPLAPLERMTIEYDFVATIPTVADRDGVNNGVYNVTFYYPILSVYTDDGWSHEAFFSRGDCNFSEVSDYDVRITAPADYILVTTGVLTDEEASGDMVTYTYEAPFVRDFVFCASRDFVIKDGYFEDIHINIVYSELDENMNDGMADKALEAAQNSLACFSDILGRYPYEELDVVFAPIMAGGMEYPTLVIIDDSYLRYPDDEAAAQNYVDNMQSTVTHEIGHQWFFAIVGNNNYLQPWQDECLASYSESIYCQCWHDHSDNSISGSIRPIDIIDESRWGADIEVYPLNRSYYEFPDDSTYVTAIYMVGDVTLRAIEDVIGRDAMRAVIREYVRRNAFTIADPNSFLDILYECCGTDNEELNHIIDLAFA